MPDKIQLLEEKVGQVLNRLDQMKADNVSLRQENEELKAQLTQLDKELTRLKLDHNDQAAEVKSKLVSMLSRIEELEKIGL